MEIKLGSTVRDLVSGVSGIATIRAELMSGTIQYNVQPKSTDGMTAPDGWAFDYQQLEVIDAGISHLAKPFDTNVEVQLGDKVQDEVTGFEGIAVEKIEYLNGCTRFVVQPKGEREKMPESIHLDHKRLKVIQPKTVKPKPTKTGGPARRMSSVRGA